MPLSFQSIAVRSVCSALAAVCLLSAPALAQDTRAAQERVCGHDVSRHCRRVLHDGDMAIHQCLQENHDRLSSACRKLIDSH
jgi:hypothetical protein